MGKIISFEDEKDRLLDEQIEAELNDPEFMKHFGELCADIQKRSKETLNSLNYKIKLF